jgi:putative transposase
MRLTADEKAEVIRLVISSPEGVNKTLRSLGIHKRTFYNWYHAYSRDGIDGLLPKGRSSRQWNRIPHQERQLIVDVALEHTDLSPRELAVKITDEQQLFVSESSVYRILKSRGLIAPSPHTFIVAADQFHTKTKFPNEMWQTDFTYFKIKGWGWYFLSTILDDYSRYIVHHELCSTMKAEDVRRSVEKAMERAQIGKKDAPKLLSDNGACYIAKDLGEYLSSQKGIQHIRGKPMHPQTQGKIERYHRSIKSIVLLDNYYCPEQLACAIDQYVDYYNTKRYHESLDNLTPEDVYLGRGEQILKLRQKIKEKTIRQRRDNYQMAKLLEAVTG